MFFILALTHAWWQDVLHTSSNTCLMHTVDTDVVIIIIGKFHALTANYLAADNTWIALVRTYINTICNALEQIHGISYFSLLYWLLYLLGGKGKRSRHGRPGKHTQR